MVKKVFAALFALSLSATAMAGPAPQVTLTVGAGGSQDISPGDALAIDIVSTDMEPMGNGIAAWSIAIAHDPTKLQIDTAVQGDLSPVGGSAGFENVSIISNSSGDGFINATILDFFGNVAFPGGGTQILSSATYTNLMVAGGDITNIEVVDGVLANVPSPAVAVSVSLFDGTNVDQASGALGIENLELVNVVPPAFELSVADVSETIVLPGTVEASVDITLDQINPFLGVSPADVNAVALTLNYDSAQVAVDGVTAGGGGTDASTDDGMGSLDLLINGLSLDATGGAVVATITFVPAGMPVLVGGENFSSALSAAGDGVITVGVDMGDAAVTDGSVSITAVSTLDFRRGDCNDDGLVNIADAITIIQGIVAAMGGGGSVDCESACDSDGDGTIILNDAILLLAFSLGLDPVDLSMFSPGAAVLAAPGTSCGQVAGQSPEDCMVFDSCP